MQRRKKEKKWNPNEPCSTWHSLYIHPRRCDEDTVNQPTASNKTMKGEIFKRMNNFTFFAFHRHCVPPSYNMSLPSAAAMSAFLAVAAAAACRLRCSHLCAKAKALPPTFAFTKAEIKKGKKEIRRRRRRQLERGQTGLILTAPMLSLSPCTAILKGKSSASP